MIYDMRVNMLILERNNDSICKNRFFSCLFVQCGLRIVFVLIWCLLRGYIYLPSVNIPRTYCLYYSSVTRDLRRISWRKSYLGCSWHGSAAMSSQTVMISFRSTSHTAWMSLIVWANSSSSFVDLTGEMAE